MGFKTARLKAGKTVTDAMTAFNVSDAAVYSWEAGAYMPRASLLMKIAEYYGCTVEELLVPDKEEAHDE